MGNVRDVLKYIQNERMSVLGDGDLLRRIVVLDAHITNKTYWVPTT